MSNQYGIIPTPPTSLPRSTSSNRPTHHVEPFAVKSYAGDDDEDDAMDFDAQLQQAPTLEDYDAVHRDGGGAQQRGDLKAAFRARLFEQTPGNLKAQALLSRKQQQAGGPNRATDPHHPPSGQQQLPNPSSSAFFPSPFSTAGGFDARQHAPLASPFASPRAASAYGREGDLTPRVIKQQQVKALRELKAASAAEMLKSDPFARPRATDSRKEAVKRHLLRGRGGEDPQPEDRSRAEGGYPSTPKTSGDAKYAGAATATAASKSPRGALVPTPKAHRAPAEQPADDEPLDTSYIPKVPFNQSMLSGGNTMDTKFIKYVSSLPGYEDIYNPNRPVFLYLKRKSKDEAYAFVICSHEQILKSSQQPPPGPSSSSSSSSSSNAASSSSSNDPLVYYMLSSKGVMTFSDGDSSFQTIQDFEREFQIYSDIKNIPFFRKYHVWKGFEQWKRGINAKRIARCKTVLREELFILHPQLRESLIKLRKLCYELSLLRLHQIDPSSTFTMDTFCEQQSRQKTKLLNLLERFSIKVIDIVRDTCDRSLSEFLGQSGFTRNQGRALDASGAVTEITFTERAAMRTFCRKLSKFIRLADFIVCSCFITIAIHSTSDLLNHMIRGQQLIKEEDIPALEPLFPENYVKAQTIAFNRAAAPTSVPLFEVELVLSANGQCLEYTPNEMLLRTRLENMLFDSLNVVSTPVRLLTHATFKSYVEPSIDENGPIGEGLDLENMLMEDEFFQDMLEGINECTENAFDRAGVYCEAFDEITDMYLENEKFLKESRLNTFIHSSLEELKELLEKYEGQEAVFKRIKTRQDLGMLSINTVKLDSVLRNSPTACLSLLHNILPEMYTVKNEDLLARMTRVHEKINFQPTTVAEFSALSENYAAAVEDLPQMEEDFTFLLDLYALMAEFSVKLSDETRTRSVMLQSTQSHLKSAMTYVEEGHEDAQMRFTQILLKQVQAWQPRVAAMVVDINSPITDSVDADVGDVISYLEESFASMDAIQSEAHAYAHQQSVMKVTFLDLEEMNATIKTLDLKLKLWRGLESWAIVAESWMDVPIHQLDIEESQEIINSYWVKVAQCENGLTASPVVESFKSKVQRFRQTLPVVSSLRCPSLKERHWETVRLILGYDVTPDSGVNLGHLIEHDAMVSANSIATVTVQAENEDALHKALSKIQRVWDTASFEVSNYKERRDVFILTEVDDVIIMLDDSMVSINTVLGSQFVGAIREEVENWKSKLILLQNTLEQWLMCQKSWIHLESIFSAPDIQKQLPSESKAFRVVDIMWRDVMKKTFQDPNCIRAGTFAGLLEMFENSNTQLDKVQRGLDEYLELKRHAFPRFYFLADAELLSLLSQARDPRAVQPHMRKLFDAIYELDFGDQKSGTSVHAMLSQDKERIPLGPNLKARGNLEDWLGMVEEYMKKCLYRLSKTALLDIQNVGPKSNDDRSRCDWVLQHPAQCVTSIAQIMWARGCEEAITSPDSNAMNRWYNTSMAYLEELTELIRSDITPMERKVTVALVTADVHSRDIIETLIQQKVTVISSFVWQAQLRYYWTAASEGSEEDIRVRQSNCVINYGYEYMGPTTRLVITPLTDRCWMTITGAYDLKLGAGPSGPAGTGKTESSKDLAKALAIYCIVFNCSEQIDFSMIGRVLSGLAQCGAWTCLDEFNRIGVEVLSVISQQISTLRQGRMALSGNNAVAEIVFEGREISLKDHHIIITMNPNYAGRTELPDNLKIHFRPVYMMIPDYALISEIIMYSEGFVNSSVLCRKITKLYKTAAEMLSQQPHYDFGMRAVKSVLIMAGKMKREDPDAPEDEILIKAMEGSNVPKLLQQDIPLYNELVRDLFPNTTLTSPRHDEIAHLLRKILATQKLKYTPTLAEKAVQLRETLSVRFGVALVGVAGSGKTTIYTALAATFRQLYVDNFGKYAPGLGPQPVVFEVINPKSLTVGELYGSFNAATQEWTDGIAAFSVRNAANPPEGELLLNRWVVFDGPIDPLWVENLNTVLDDNMLMCLASGERIKLRQEMKMLFEVSDLNAASPATVSRLGIVYVPKKTVGIDALCSSWCVNHIQSDNGFSEEEFARLSENFTKLSLPVAEFLRDRCVELIPTSDMGAMATQCSILEALISKYSVLFAKTSSVSPEDRISLLDQFFFYSLVWGWGGALEGDYAEAFNIFLRDVLSDTEYDADMTIPAIGSVFDYFLDVKPPMNVKDKVTIWPTPSMKLTADDEETEGGGKSSLGDNKRGSSQFGFVQTTREVPPLFEWRTWHDAVTEFKYEQSMPFASMIVPTTDTVKFQSLAKVLSMTSRPIFFTGESGCGKSIVVDVCTAAFREPEVNGGFNSSLFFMSYSAHSSSLYTQRLFEKKLEKKRKNLWGAPESKTIFVFIDDINLPTPDTHGSQPPLELLRQLLSRGGFYEREALYWVAVVDCLYSAAASPPGGGRHVLPERFLRHFAILCIPTPKPDSIKHIFNSMLRGHMDVFSDAVKMLCHPMVNSTIDMYQRIHSSLLPTPSRSHYLFSMRDIGKVFQGVMMAKDVSSVGNVETMTRLWLHELMRVFHDRLIGVGDRDWFYDLCVELLLRHFRVAGEGWTKDDLFPPSDDNIVDIISSESTPAPAAPGEIVPTLVNKKKKRLLLFVDFLNPGIQAEERSYEESKSVKDLVTILDEYQMEFNIASTRKLNLVFFTDAVKHIARICRVLRQPRGSMLLVGLGGSGRSSLTRLSSFIVGHILETPEMVGSYSHTNFRDDLRKVVLSAGVAGRNTVFMLMDTQVTDSRFLEDVNTILSCGEIPNLFDDEQDTENMTKMRPVAAQLGVSDTPDSCAELFVNRVKDYLHIVFCISPVGDGLKNCVRNLPSLISCTTIDWFSPWPQTALRGVARNVIKADELLEYCDKKIDPTGEKLRDGICKSCLEVHQSVQEASTRFLLKLNRRTYATPKSYIDMLELYLRMLSERREALGRRLTNLTGGVDKLEETNVTVERLQKELSKMQPNLELKAKAAAELLKVVELEQKKAAAAQEKVGQDEVNVGRRQAEVSALQLDAKRDLARAMPAYQSAVKALESLEKKDIIEIKGFTKPPLVVQTVMEAVCILLEEQPTWENARKILNRPTYMEDLANFDKDNISPKTLAKISKYIENPDIQPDSVRKVSVAAAGMCMWVHAMNVYSQVASEVAPKQARLEQMNEELASANKELKEKQTELNAVMEEVSSLQKKCEETLGEKNRLAAEVDQCSQRLVRAERLKSSLKDERVRWIETVSGLQEEMRCLIGDVFLGAATISYLGPFTGEYREQLIESWRAGVKANKVQCSANYNFVKHLGDPAAVRDWRLSGLPSDEFSAENGIIAMRGARWPLMIDPQNQASNWIRNYEGKRNMLVISVENPKLMASVENAVFNGLPLLIEDVGSTVDPVLDNLLYKRQYKSAGRTVIALGDRIVDYNPNFVMYMTTKLPNPNYLPDVFIRCTVLNFTVTKYGLEEQILSDVVKIENPDLESKYTSLLVSISSDKKQLASIEDHILHELHHSKGHLLDNEVLVNTLSDSKVMSRMVSERLIESETAEKEILATRDNYRAIAARGSIMYFLVASLTQIDPMYSYSLAYFKSLFSACIIESPPSVNLQARLHLLGGITTSTIHRYVSRGLFTRHRLMFSFLLCTKLLGLKPKEAILEEEWSALVSGGSGTRNKIDSYLDKYPCPDPETIDMPTWMSILHFSKNLKAFEGIAPDIIENYEEWKAWRTSRVPHSRKLPGTWETSLGPFQKLILVRCLCPEFGIVAVRRFVELKLGREFATFGGEASGMEALFSDMTATTPCLFVLSSGTDPMSSWTTFAKKKGVYETSQTISLGQGQGPRANALVETAQRVGSWVILQNCHLAKSWMSELERIVVDLELHEHDLNPNFRLFLTSLPVDYFPVKVLHACVKLVTEPPDGVRANMIRTFDMHIEDGMMTDDCIPGANIEWKRILYSLCMFHAVATERKKFGSIGWNVNYDFSDSDLTTAIATLRRMITDAATNGAKNSAGKTVIPIDSLKFITGQIVYGGRVTDDWDRRCLMSLIGTFYNDSALGANYSFVTTTTLRDQKGTRAPDSSLDLPAVRQFIAEHLAHVDPTALFGMHPNADVVCNREASAALFDNLTHMNSFGAGGSGEGSKWERLEGDVYSSTNDKVGTRAPVLGGAARARTASAGAGVAGGSSSAEDIVAASVASLRVELPDSLILEKGNLLHTAKKTDGMTNALTVVLFQECARFNRLLSVCKETLEMLSKAIQGEITMTQRLENVYSSVYSKKVPGSWIAVGFTSLKPLESWMADLKGRLAFMRMWLEVGKVKSYPLSAFFSPQGFLTAVLQNYARKHQVAFNMLEFAFEVLHQENINELTEYVSEGALIHGLHLQCCRWDNTLGKIADEAPQQVSSPCPILHFLPDEDHVVGDDVYVCPCYKTTKRSGTLTTSGISSNFVCAVELPMDCKSDVWVLRGAAIVCSLDY